MVWGLLHEPCLSKSKMTSRAGECKIGAVWESFSAPNDGAGQVDLLPKRTHHATHSTANRAATWKRTTPANIFTSIQLTPEQSLCRICVCDRISYGHLTNDSSIQKPKKRADMQTWKKLIKPVVECASIKADMVSINHKQLITTLLPCHPALSSPLTWLDSCSACRGVIRVPRSLCSIVPPTVPPTSPPLSFRRSFSSSASCWWST